VVQTENKTEKVSFDLRNEKEYGSNKSTKLVEEVEQTTLVVRRYEQVRKPVEGYSLPKFCYVFLLISIDEDPKSVMETVDLTKSRLWKDSMVKEMESFHKNKT
jgi:hypothetical protein